MSITSGMMSSNKQDWETPPEFMQALKQSFDLDVCAYKDTAKAPIFFTEQDNAFKQQWVGKCWMNPPYGKAIPKWLERAYKESQQAYCTSVTCLIPARTDTAWFHDFAVKGTIVLLRGRISFLQNGLAVGSPAFPSMLVIYDKQQLPKILTWAWKVK